MPGSLTVPESRAVDAGVEWDAVKTSVKVGDLARRLLLASGHPTGPVLVDAAAHTLYFFVPSGTVNVLPPIAVLLGKGSVVALPEYEPRFPLAHPRLQWMRPPDADAPGTGRYAQTGELSEALTAAAAGDRPQ